MNNQFNSANLTAAAQSHAQMTPHVAATSPPQTTSATVLNSFYNAAHSQQPQHHHHRLYADPRQLHLPANTLDKSYYTTAGAAAAANALGAALGTPQRFYTTATGPTLGTNTPGGHVPAPAASHPNTILITNNFTHQQTPAQSPEQQKMSSLNPGNIRIVASSSANPANLSSISSGYQQAQHVFNLNNMFPQHLLQQQQQNFQHAPEIITQHFSGHSAHFPTTQNATATGTTALQMPQYYMASESTMASQLPTNPKILSNIPSSAVSGASGNVASSTMNVGGGGGGNTNNNGSSTVVLDRINICINNLYTDTSSSSASNSLASTPAQQPSPIIPAIQHRPIIETGPPVTSGDLYESSVLVIDEPDSTTTATTPHTPPTTPENTPPPVSNNPNVGTNNNTITTTTNSTGNSPSTSSTSMTQPQDIKISNAITTTKQHFATVAQNIEEAAVQESSKPSKYIPPLKTAAPNTSSSATHTHSCTPITQTTTSHCNQKTIPSNTPLTPPTPPSPELPTLNVTMETSPTAVIAPPLLFANGEDVFIKRQDGRFYLGTVMDNARNQFLVRFDDKTEQWCNADEMKKLGGGSTSSDTASENRKSDQPMCVACKQQQIDSQVEICERCGRGYHRKCTMETTKDSGVWICRRCDKPMKLSNNNSNTDDDDDEEVEMEVCRQLPYDLNSLTWDNKHRVNEQQIYCYCGKSGRFDHNMLQCCRCLNWYHTECTQIFRGNLLRGDNFFVFACTICNEGGEYLRRLHIDWVDLIHLIMYNLSTMKKHQNHKYHHLLKDIYPFALEKRELLPLPKECLLMPENEFLNKIKCTLKENPERFVSGKEIKRDHYLFALRTNGPPLPKPISIKAGQILNDDFLINNLKLTLLEGAPENVDVCVADKISTPTIAVKLQHTPKSKPKSSEDSTSHDIYAFDDTSDDEIPIKLILDKVKKKNKSTENLKEDTTTTAPTTTPINKTTLEKMDVEDDNANDILISQTPPSRISTTAITTPTKSEKKMSLKQDSKPPKSSSETNSMDENMPLVDAKVSATPNSTIDHHSNMPTNKHIEKSSRKRKAFTLTKSYDKQRLFDSSSDENSSSSSRCTSLDLIIPPPKNFLGQNNPFRMITPKKKSSGSPPLGQQSSLSSGKKSVSFGIFNTNGLNFSSKLAALKSAGLFPKLSSSNLAKAAGQPRTVRTIKRRLSAKDITIGPNQEVRRRRIRRLSANVEVISTTTINPIPTNYFPIHAKDLLAAAAASTKTAASLFNNNNNNTHAKSNFSTSASSSPTTSSLSAKQEVNTNADCAPIVAPPPASNVDIKQQPVVPTHGRRLRQRPPKSSPNTSRRNSVSSNQSSTSSSTTSATASQQIQNVQQSHEDLKQTVNKYFGIVNRIESGEQFSIRAKRLLPNGQMQYLIEWGEQQQQPSPVIVAPPTTPTAALGNTVAHVAETTTTSNDIIQQNDADSQLALTHNNGQVTDEMSVN